MMDSWKYLADGRGVCLTEEFDFQLENHGCKSKLMGTEHKPMSNNGEIYPLGTLERLDFMGNMGFDEIRKSYSISSEPNGEVFHDEIGDDYGNLVASSPFSEDKDSGSRKFPDCMQSNTQDLAVVDLKLGWLAADGGVAKDENFSDCSLAGSSALSSSPVKRPRSTTGHMQPPTCQVLGCNKDLSFHKGYYKRHRVCDEHTRTAKVVVKGLEQRFCQQCSRFHQLSEFDDGKRSCRRRLAAHNKRRRKPQFASESGLEMIDFSSSSSQAILEDLPTATTDGSGNSRAWKWVENIKVEDSLECSEIFFHASNVGKRMNHNQTDMKGKIIGTTTTASILNSSTVEQTSRALSLLSPRSPNMSVNHLHQNTITSLSYTENHHADSSSTCRDATQSDSNSNTVMDLHQLSSHLRRIEQQRHSTES